MRRAVLPRRGKPAVGSVSEVAAVYDDVFENDKNFDTLDSGNAPKLKYVQRYATKVEGHVLDAGSGRGSVLRYMLDQGVDAFGIELSKSACDMYLQGLPHANADIISWAKQGHRYEGLVCTDVLEHIPREELDGVLSALATMAPSGLLGIANHSSIHNGHELHVIQEGRRWWMKRLGQYFRSVEVVKPDAEDEVLVRNFDKDVFFFLHVASDQHA